MAVIVTGELTMYDIRTTWKGTAGQALTAGWSVYLKIADGLVWPCINLENTYCHGWVLTSCLAGETVTIVTGCRMKTDQIERPGYHAGVGQEATGTAPSSLASHSAFGEDVGFATHVDQLWLTVTAPAGEM